VNVVILNQLQLLHAGMPVLADDDVIVHEDAMSMIVFVIRISACDSADITWLVQHIQRAFISSR
jgi:hypothetical protein